ncbi:hypothetical protein DACRYDRAFT_112631 [Dacryopinax primogenitus]|uniref:DNA-directed RNA polymerase III subunit RPC9 n=1 Tax=Dacryopinax primogenitus (strain DJM 731) TaxID=1858805 RepID=M5FYK0_DACPD|nr:uncharacterized protein DACRYDRAFT_112631 [Dacryopinax primogenitus]EJT96592.1 hypothetical protein DACRYDRAFT_112631 [Dacryopinax primogenitus]
MEILNPRTSLLSNRELLSLIQESDTSTTSLLPANQRSLSIALRSYLTSTHVDTALQTHTSLRLLVHGLARWDLTKAEKLQIVNLMPTSLVVLYTVIEDFEYRFPQDSANGILALVQACQAEAGTELVAARGSPDASSKPEALDRDGEGEELFLPEAEAEGEGEGEGEMQGEMEGEGMEMEMEMEEFDWGELDDREIDEDREEV